jgi:hypothetical protein
MPVCAKVQFEVGLLNSFVQCMWEAEGCFFVLSRFDSLVREALFDLSAFLALFCVFMLTLGARSDERVQLIVPIS